MTKWVENKDVVFTCQRDVYEYLLTGNKIKNILIGGPYIDMIIGFDDEGNIGNWFFSNPNEWLPMKRAEWYEDIPENGVLCWVSDSVIVKKKIAVIITEYRDTWFYSSSGMPWKNACPLTKEDAMQYLLPD